MGGFQPEESLPPERALARTLGIGRTTLRTALRQLAEEGLVSTTLGRNGGTVVLASGRTTPTKRSLIVKEAEDALEHALEARLALEPLAARLAAARAGAGDRESLFHLLSQPARTLDAYHALDSRFHTQVARVSDNPLLPGLVERVRTHFFTWANSLWLNIDWRQLGSVRTEPAEAFRTDHRPIAEAIAAGDAEKAHAAMARHLQISGEQFRELLHDAGTLRPTEGPIGE